MTVTESFFVLRMHTPVSQRLTGQAFTVMLNLKLKINNYHAVGSLDHVLLPWHLILFPPLFLDAFVHRNGVNTVL